MSPRSAPSAASDVRELAAVPATRSSTPGLVALPMAAGPCWWAWCCRQVPFEHGGRGWGFAATFSSFATGYYPAHYLGNWVDLWSFDFDCRSLGLGGYSEGRNRVGFAGSTSAHSNYWPIPAITTAISAPDSINFQPDLAVEVQFAAGLLRMLRTADLQSSDQSGYYYPIANSTAAARWVAGCRSVASCCRSSCLGRASRGLLC